MKNKFVVIPGLFSAMFLLSCGSSNDKAKKSEESPAQNLEAKREIPATVVDIALSSPNFSTLVSFLQAADLVGALQTTQNLTVFAPTNEAFAKLPAEVVDALKANPELLKQVLLYHVAPSTLDSGKVTTAETVATLQGETIKVSLRDGAAYLNDSKISAVDLTAKNGIVHVIDTVLVPQKVLEALQAPKKTIFDIAQGAGNFSILLKAIDIVGLTETIKGPGTFTVFAPTDAAFNALGKTLEAALADKSLLTSILTYHVLDKKLLAKDVLAACTLVTLNGQSLNVDKTTVKVNDANIVATDLVGSNGVVHVIDKVLLPK